MGGAACSRLVLVHMGKRRLSKNPFLLPFDKFVSVEVKDHRRRKGKTPRRPGRYNALFRSRSESACRLCAPSYRMCATLRAPFSSKTE
jgi:hypothetical protein